MKNALFILVGLLTLQTRTTAQTDQFKFKQLTIRSGLSHNQVNTIYKDKTGFLWIGTQAGLNRFDGNKIKTFVSDSRDSTAMPSSQVTQIFPAPKDKLIIQTGNRWCIYDPLTEKFSRNVSGFLKSFNIPLSSITEIEEDFTGNFWFVMNNGLGVTAKNNLGFFIQKLPGADETLIENPVTDLAHDGSGNSWAIHLDGSVDVIKLHEGELKVVRRYDYLAEINQSRSFSYRLDVDSDGEPWVFVLNDNQGVYHYDLQNNRWAHFDTKSHPLRLNTDIVSALGEDQNGLMWIGTDHGGVNLIDKRKNTVRYLQSSDEDPTSLGQNSVNALYRDDEGIMWIGTYKRGLSYYHKNIFRFPVYNHLPFDHTGLPYADVNRFIEDDKGNIWIGTNGGGLVYFDRSAGTFKQFLHQPDNPKSLSSNVIVSLCFDQNKNLLIGTYYGGLNVFDGKNFTTYVNDPDNENSLSGRNVWEIFKDSQNNIWVGTLEGGVNQFFPETRTFKRFPSGPGKVTRSTYISEIMEDRDGQIWFGTTIGIDVYDPKVKQSTHYEYLENDNHSLSNSYVYDIHQDRAGRIWVATMEGLNIFDASTKKFSVLRDRDGLPHNTVLTIEEDSRGHLWLGTPNGLCEMIVGNEPLHPSFAYYNESDGLQGSQFNENAAYISKAGELLFGGPNGFNVFKPENLFVDSTQRKIVFTDLQLFQKPVAINEEVSGEIILDKAISLTNNLVLPSNQNSFSLEFSDMNFFQTGKNEYHYKLVGLSDNWLPVDNGLRKITFTGLRFGDYVLHVRVRNQNGSWSTQPATLAIKILPPFWLTNFAFILYFMVLASILFFARRLIQQREKMKFQVLEERREVIRMQELDLMKVKFFTNVSHEFRTPLTLILTPLEKLIRHASEDEKKGQYVMIQRNAKRLLNLVNQLLDFRKLEVQEIRFNPSEGNIIAFIKETVSSFSDLSEKKNIKLNFSTGIESLETIFDQDKLERILFNLLSNAFKFTPENGAVRVHVGIKAKAQGKVLKIEVADTGIGIPPDKLDKVFDRFFQTELPDTIINQGSGIGLAITKEFVRIHGGEIEARSENGKGSTFTVWLPVRELFKDATADVNVEELSSPVVEEVMKEESLAEATDFGGLRSVLLIEDNDDFRFYLKDNLKQFYRIHDARNGEDGWKLILSVQPDLIVSDVMMPGLNGSELCKRVKSDERVSHIPVILLTARSSDEQKLEGIQAGADDYITKPFNFEILESRIKNLIDLRMNGHRIFKNTFDIKASELQITSLDQKFIENAIKCVERNVSSPHFSVEHLGRELGISRAYLYKKIVALTGKSPLELIRTIRLQHAAQLLEKSQLTVAEVAYQVGFNNPKYFTKYFKEQFNVLPSNYGSSRKKSD